jgi:hypothetical protein
MASKNPSKKASRPKQQNGRTPPDALDRHITEEVDRFYRMCPPKQEPVLSVLRGHLLTEYYLERLLVLGLPRGDRLVGDAGLSYAQKVTVVESLDILEDKTIQCLRGLNRVRNSCAHEMDREISLADVERIGRPLGPEFTTLRREHYADIPKLLSTTIMAVCTGLTYWIYELETQAVSQFESDLGRDEGATDPTA